MKHFFFSSAVFILCDTFAACASGGGTGDGADIPGEPQRPETAVRQLDYGGLLAFPYAEGWGRNTSGGRGGKVYHVTSLEDSGAGTLRDALSKSGPKTIVFDVSGTIHLKSGLKTGKDNLTIAGQTSPGGICIAGNLFTINSNNVIIRFLRFRPGNPEVDGDGLGGSDKKDIIIDHCSISWGTDECLSVYGMQNSTVQWCLAYQALRVSDAKQTPGGKFKTHGFGGNWGGHYASYHHNLIAHCESRVPRLGPRYTTLALDNNNGEKVDIRNNVYYNWSGEGCYGGEAQHVNIVNNYYKPGPATAVTGKGRGYRIAKPDVYAAGYANGYEQWRQKWGSFHITGNVVDGNAEVTADNWTKGVFAQMDKKNCATEALWEQRTAIKSDKPVVGAGGVRTQSAKEAYLLVLAYSGASNYRDALDKLILGDVEDGTASATGDASKWASLTGYSQNKKGYINVPSDVCAALGKADPYDVLTPDKSIDTKDSDGDGIPDYWEKEYGLDSANAADGNEKIIDKHGRYTNLEMYLNSLVHEIMEKGAAGGTVVE